MCLTVTEKNAEPFDEATVLSQLQNAWSIETSTLWTAKNPARGQCPVTALVIQDHFAGEIRKTPTDDGPHFYNVIEGERYDLTAGQFESLPTYLDLPSDRSEAFEHTNETQYDALSEEFPTEVIEN